MENDNNDGRKERGKLARYAVPIGLAIFLFGYFLYNRAYSRGYTESNRLYSNGFGTGFSHGVNVGNRERQLANPAVYGSVIHVQPTGYDSEALKRIREYETGVRERASSARADETETGSGSTHNEADETGEGNS